MSIKEKLTALADAIRAKSGTTAAMTLDEMTAAVKNLSLSEDSDGTTATHDNCLRYVSVDAEGFPTEVDASSMTTLARCQFACAADSYYSDYPLYARMTKVTLPSSLDTLPSTCFARCSALQTVVWPDDLTTIGRYCFSYCTSMVFDLPATLTTVEPYGMAYVESPSFTTLILPASVTTLKANAFRGNASITTVTFRGTPSSIATTVFNECTGITDIYVPWSEDAISGAPWGATNATVHYNS